MHKNILLAIAGTLFAQQQMRYVPMQPLTRLVRKREVRERIRDLKEQMRQAGIL